VRASTFDRDIRSFYAIRADSLRERKLFEEFYTWKKVTLCI